ncbi:hypothetical protein A8C56_06210 [Niabella ginsenosidivorans]|uniref:GT-D fold-like domain-containing protein n=1 Tax=Niabella ginsenosidivorans TaxID=1176587 RepID=A0A1A9I0M6_9BACT|nr:hypothetical protein [Niabella ginsenosidivorans]ANH80629.1 hypothetical protein A8C56_06210 [Niabella ginsenosidivorans]
MSKLFIVSLKALRKIYAKVFRVPTQQKPVCEQNAEVASGMIYDKLMSDEPCMIARFGSTELSAMVNYLGVKNSNSDVWRYIQGRALPWWWNENIMNQMQQWSGFFPPTREKIERFCELMMEDMKQVDVLGSWLADERFFEPALKDAVKIRLLLLEPFWTAYSWMKALENKKVLVIHPFAETIITQYERREKLFKNQTILPEFLSLRTIKAVQSLGGQSNQFEDWFEALSYMKRKTDEAEFDIALIGCGAYGFPLAAHIKRAGKKAIHIGGALQLMFGIKGKRWEDENFGEKTFGKKGVYRLLMNEHWVYPQKSETPKTAGSVENACYW